MTGLTVVFDGDLKHVPDVTAFGLNLPHVVSSTDVLNQLGPLGSVELARLAAVQQEMLLLSLRRVSGLQLHQMLEQGLADLMSRASRVQLELVHRIGVVVAGVAAHLNRVRHVDVLEFPRSVDRPL